MNVAMYVVGLAVGLVLGAFFKIPALAAAVAIVALAATLYFVLAGSSLADATVLALPTMLCIQAGYLIGAAVRSAKNDS